MTGAVVHILFCRTFQILAPGVSGEILTPAVCWSYASIIGRATNTLSLTNRGGCNRLSAGSQSPGSRTEWQIEREKNPPPPLPHLHWYKTNILSLHWWITCRAGTPHIHYSGSRIMHPPASSHLQLHQDSDASGLLLWFLTRRPEETLSPTSILLSQMSYLFKYFLLTWFLQPQMLSLFLSWK